MTTSLHPKSALDYSVFSAAAAALLLGVKMEEKEPRR
jgi:hypothetical protein